jgi:hypothetical protein
MGMNEDLPMVLVARKPRFDLLPVSTAELNVSCA